MLRRPIPFTAQALQKRRPIWLALSDLYLDGEPEWERVAQVCAASEFSLPELQRILFDEVHPVVHWNLLFTAGEWVGFDEAWLVRSIVSRKGRYRWHLPWLEAGRYPWRQLRPLIVAARQSAGLAP